MEVIDLVNSVIIFVSQMTFNYRRWLTFLLGSLDSHSPALLDLFLSSDASICSAMVFHPSGNSDHVVVSAQYQPPFLLGGDNLLSQISEKERIRKK